MNRRRKSSNSTPEAARRFDEAIGDINGKLPRQRHSFAWFVLVFFCIFSISAWCNTGTNQNHGQLLPASDDKEQEAPAPSTAKPEVNQSYQFSGQKTDDRTIHSLKDLKPSELHPQATSTRHIVTPPKDDIPITLVTCQTTKGFLHIVVHPSWAPLGASRFLRMVTTKYFSTKIAMMRCLKGFLCQFGLAGDPSYNKEYVGQGKNLEDDPNWLPEGPAHRTNDLGVKRFAKGYLAYAGAGKNSRSNQLIVALANNERLGGGSPWEVPCGELVGDESFATLDKIYTGYGEKGPSQGRLSREGSSEAIAQEFPDLDYILSCQVVESEK